MKKNTTEDKGGGRGKKGEGRGWGWGQKKNFKKKSRGGVTQQTHPRTSQLTD